MPNAINKLTDRKIQSIKAAGRYSDGGGLYVRVSKTGAKSFSFRTIRNGKATEIGLGAYPTKTLAFARTEATALRDKVDTQGALLGAGHAPPITEQASVPNNKVTFGEASAAYMDTLDPIFKNQKHREQWRMTLGPSYCGSILDRPVDTIQLNDVLAILKPIWTTKAETAYRIRGRIERVLDYCRVQGCRSGENPARWRGNLDAILPSTHKIRNEAHFEAVDYNDLPALFQELDAKQTIGAQALQFTILTAARTNETMGARWSEFDLKKDCIWTVPAERMKRGITHVVPLSNQCVNSLTALRNLKVSEFVFPGQRLNRPISNMAMLKLLKSLGKNETVHGFRSTFTDWIAEETDFDAKLADFALAHGLSNKTTAAYRRKTSVEKRRPIMQAWADYCYSKVNLGQ